MDNFKFVQNQPTTLAGAGSSLGDTTIILTSFTQIDGTLLTMTDFGTIGFGTLEPGNGIQEEQISWTGITQNANGTATLTGVKTVLNVSPYTQTSGLSTSHAGGVQFVVSNTAGFYDRLSAKNDDETITGTWAFTNPNYPRIDTATPPPTDNEQLATKKYVDDTTIAGAPNASTSVQGLVQLPTQAEVDARTSPGTTGAELAIYTTVLRSTLLSDIAIDTGSTNTYVITPSPVITTYGTGQTFTFKASTTNSGASTININSLGTKSITQPDGTTLGSGAITSGQISLIEYDGTKFQMLSTPGGVVTTTGTQTITGAKTVTTPISGMLNYQAFAASGTWTKPSNLNGNELVIIQLWGGGGSGAGGDSTAGGGGGGGAFTEAQVIASSVSSTVAVTVGTGGTVPGTNTPGNAGGNSSFGATYIAFGGGGGGTQTTGGSGGGGGGGGGGNFTKGSNASGDTGGAGGSIGGGAASGGSSAFGGAAGGSGSGGAGGASTYGGGGGGSGSYAGAGSYGGISYFGGGGGSGAATTGSALAGGTAIVYGGNGGAGSLNGSASAGTVPGGGGGGGGGGTPAGARSGGAGAAGQAKVWVITGI